MSIRYKCDNKQSVQVDYNIPGKTARATVTTSKAPATGKAPAAGKPSTPAKTSWTMNRIASDSGTRYEDAKSTMAWSAQGSTGHLTDLKSNKSIRCTEYASSR
jgi:membrane-bound inhibitor of C-type lysozyme